MYPGILSVRYVPLGLPAEGYILVLGGRSGERTSS